MILDIDETVLDNSPFQILLAGRPFDFAEWDAWVARAAAEAVPGAVDFVRRAESAGVAVFYVTNRECAPRDGSAEACPQEAETLENLRRVGLDSTPERLLLKNERTAWSSEKEPRRELVARDHRVIMLFGDDLGDFLPCVRGRIVPPCTAPATGTDRRRSVREHADYWGRGWYVLPNPMYGSWTGVR